MVMMQRFLTHCPLWRIVAVHPLLMGKTLTEPAAAAVCCCSLRIISLPPTGHRHLTTSSSCWTAHQSGNLPPQKEAQSTKTPQTQDQREEAAAEEVDPLQDKSIGLFQRFKRTFKQYGKVMIPVHLVTSSVWFGTFYYAAMK